MRRDWSRISIEYDLVIGARSGPIARQPRSPRRQPGAQCSSRGISRSKPIADLTSGFRAAARDGLLEFLHLLPNGFSTPTTTTLAFIKAGYSVRFEPIEAAQRQGQSKIRLGPDGVRFFLILLKVITIFSPLRIFLPISAAAFLLGAAYAVVDDCDAVAHHQFFGAADPDERGHPARGPGVGADLGAALRGAAIVSVPTRTGHRPDLQRAREPADPRRTAAAPCRTSGCSSSTISRRMAPATSPTISRGSTRAASR